MALRRLQEEGSELRRATDFNAEFAPEACSIDLRRANPSVQRDMLWRHLAERMNRALFSVHRGTLCKVRLRAECGDPCWPGKALRGCPTSPILFFILHDESLRHAREERDKHALTHGLGDVGSQWDSTQPGRPSKQCSGQGRKGGRTFCSTIQGTRKELWTGGGADATATAMKLCDQKREWLELGVDDETKFLVDQVPASLSTESGRG